MDGVDNAMERLEAFRYGSGGAIVPHLRELVDKMAFEEISVMTFPSRRKILAASDSGVTLRTVKSWFEDRYDVFPANTAAMVLKCLKSNRPDVILIDEGMPGDEGKSALDILRQSAEPSGIEIVVLPKAYEPQDIIKTVDGIMQRR
jgi:CheY-like chemotaxis protein